jgi:hypothetical protein
MERWRRNGNTDSQRKRERLRGYNSRSLCRGTVIIILISAKMPISDS